VRSANGALNRDCFAVPVIEMTPATYCVAMAQFAVRCYGHAASTDDFVLFIFRSALSND
jgi:hypothetical protein